MKIYNGGRRSGKRAKLIRDASKTGYAILVRDKETAAYIEYTARKMGVLIRPPITLADLKRSKMRGSFERGIMVDNAEQVLQDMIADYTDGRGVLEGLTITTEERFMASVNEHGDIVIKRIDSEEGEDAQE